MRLTACVTIGSRVFRTGFSNSARKVQCDFAHDMFLGCCSIGMDQSAFRFTSSARTTALSQHLRPVRWFCVQVPALASSSAPFDLAAQRLTFEALVPLDVLITFIALIVHIRTCTDLIALAASPQMPQILPPERLPHCLETSFQRRPRVFCHSAEPEVTFHKARALANFRQEARSSDTLSRSCNSHLIIPLPCRDRSSTPFSDSQLPFL